MASITYWHRLEVRPRSANIAPALAARIRDPLWMLTRQWQFGEFQGEDAASPAFVELTATSGRILGWQQDADTLRLAPEGAPLEPLVQSEPFSPDLASRVEVGQLFEQLLAEAGVPELVTDFRRAYPIAVEGEVPAHAAPDREAARFRQVVAGRALDGIRLHEAAAAAAPALPAAPAVDQPRQQAVRTALSALRAWIEEVWGGFGTADAPAWDPERLEYRVSLVAAAPTGAAMTLEAEPAAGGDFVWTALAAGGAAAALGAVPPGAVQSLTRSAIPSHVRFRGMPNHRWWDFENGQIDFGALAPDTRDLTKLLVMDFMLVAGNDWFLVPLEIPVGSLCRLDAVVVHDVFGGTTRLERADGGGGGQRWTLFSTTAAEGLADFLVLPQAAGAAVLDGVVLEDVRFLRDEMANMAWAVESVTENGLGAPWAGAERDRAVHGGPASPPPVSPPDPTGPPLRYQLRSRVPEHWIPLVPVAIDPAEGDIALERGAMLREGPQPTPIAPAGRILKPSALGGGTYRIREEEVPREGVRVVRVVRRVRGSDGGTHLWVARKKQIGRGEGSSGLRFDAAAEG